MNKTIEKAFERFHNIRRKVYSGYKGNTNYMCRKSNSEIENESLKMLTIYLDRTPYRRVNKACIQIIENNCMMSGRIVKLYLSGVTHV